MGIEIEKKFLLKNDSWRKGASGELYRQGYIMRGPVVVRIRTAGAKGFITIKGELKSISRPEYEYSIPFEEANEMLDAFCEKPLIEKTRYKVFYAGRKWEIDEFHGENQGLLFAELEIENENAVFEMPDWIGEEVTQDRRYYNSNLVKNPYKNWAK